jgi:uncharacterized protein (DUF608 family)
VDFSISIPSPIFKVSGMTSSNRSCNCSGGCESPSRRDFLKLVGLGAAAVTTGMPIMAGDFNAADFEKLIPADKKLTPEWIQSLFARGARTIYRGVELEKIGMPIGGICTGQVYLGGDGKLWHWDIFNQHIGTGESHYANPPKPEFPVEQGFAIKITQNGKTGVRNLDHTGFSDIAFTGEYPIGYVNYRDPQSPITVSLEAFSPFLPLNPEDSHLPATIFQFTVKNESNTKAECELAGWLQNAVCLNTATMMNGMRENAIEKLPNATQLYCSASSVEVPENEIREPFVFADFEGEDYGAWKVEGEAFGKAPAKGAPNDVQKLSGFQGKGLANSWPGADEPKGKLTSPQFTIERPFITFQIGGGDHPHETCINLLIDGKVARTATGKNTDAMTWVDWGVRAWIGKTAQIEIVDNHSGGWGHIDIDHIEFRDNPRGAGISGKFQDQPDYGSMALALLDPQPGDTALPQKSPGQLPHAAFAESDGVPPTAVGMPFDDPMQPNLIGVLSRKLSLAPGQQAEVSFVVAWHFPNIRHLKLPDINGRKYGKRFASVREVVDFIAANVASLSEQTHQWHDTWYDSTLPYWFLDRTFLNISTLATSTAYWFGNNRFYGWEGVGCCEGTCQHVWHYAHAVARIFPSIERTTREMVDYGLAFHEDTGAMNYRAEFGPIPAHDGQAGTILRAYREHQMSPDDAFLKKYWPKIKKSLEFLISQDPNQDGILDGAQYNTLDAAWYGKIAWISSLYVASLRAGEQMAREMGDDAFAERAKAIAEAGTRNIDQELFNGEYYYQIADKEHADKVGSFDSCEIDQVFGQSWAFQVGLPRILPREHTLTALRSLWKYNFTPDVGAFRNANKPGRWYAMAGEGGLIMATWPKGNRQRVQEGFDFYFNECMNGFEYQVAGHMIWEGMVQEGLAITRAIHDRYHASRRNPWNEVECGDHYARSMASYGVYIAACGYQYHGPKGQLGFAPRLTPDNFKAAFTVAEGWGQFRQKRTENQQTEQVEIRSGQLRLTSLDFELAEKAVLGPVTVQLGGQPIKATATASGNQVHIAFQEPIIVDSKHMLDVTMTVTGTHAA